MKKLKFKAYSHRYKTFFDVVFLDLTDMTGYVDFEGNEGDVWDANFDGKDYTLLQATGKTDKNGEEIYEPVC